MPPRTGSHRFEGLQLDRCKVMRLGGRSPRAVMAEGKTATDSYMYVSRDPFISSQSDYKPDEDVKDRCLRYILFACQTRHFCVPAILCCHFTSSMKAFHTRLSYPCPCLFGSCSGSSLRRSRQALLAQALHKHSHSSSGERNHCTLLSPQGHL